MLKRHAHVSVERVCSGLAIPELFAFMTTRQQRQTWLLSRTGAGRRPDAGDCSGGASRPTQGQRSCDIAVHTLRLFVDILADEAANLALKTLALGGIFLGGGLAPRLLPFLDPERFMAVFARGTYRDWLSRIPIHIIRNPHTALLGAAAYGAAMQWPGSGRGKRHRKTPLPRRKEIPSAFHLIPLCSRVLPESRVRQTCPFLRFPNCWSA